MMMTRDSKLNTMREARVTEKNMTEDLKQLEA